jgi:hypothetical protein
MTLANMRANGVRAVTAKCQACNHKADVDALPGACIRARGRPAATVQPLRRQDDLNPTRMAYREPTSGHAGLSTASDAALIKHDVASSGGARRVIHNTKSR